MFTESEVKVHSMFGQTDNFSAVFNHFIVIDLGDHVSSLFNHAQSMLSSVHK